MNSVKKNTEIWEELYNTGRANLHYPNEMFVRVFNKYKNTRAISKVLDYGFGSGANLIHMVEMGCEVFGAEVSESALQIVNNKLQQKNIKANLSVVKVGTLPYEDNSFDAVVAWQVLVYNDIDSFKATMSEISRVLKPGGLFIGTMTAVNDCTHTSSDQIGDYLYQSNIESQKGAICIILDREDLNIFFPDKDLTVGEYSFNFDNVTGRHWVVVYEN